MRFIAADHAQPFFVYLATNAPHDPYLVADRYKQPYQGNGAIPNPAFHGMIANIDENFGRLRGQLASLGIEDNTILIFMTDNGSSGGARLDAEDFVTAGYNAGMRGKKGSYYDGGHRVPFFLRWPAGGIAGGRDIEEMALATDVMPTLIDVCGLCPPHGVRFDGLTLRPLLRGQS